MLRNEINWLLEQEAFTKEWAVLFSELLCSYWPIVRSIRENIWTTVLKYGVNEKLRSKSFLVWTKLIGQWELYWNTKAFWKFRTEHIVSSLTAAVRREFFSISAISFKVKAFIKNKNKNWCKSFCRLFYWNRSSISRSNQYGFARTAD